MKLSSFVLLCLVARIQVCLIACEQLEEKSGENEEGAAASEENSRLRDLGNFLNLGQVDKALQELRRNIQLRWESERQKWTGGKVASDTNGGDKQEGAENEEEVQEANFMVLALNELRKFKHEMELEQARYNEVVMRRQLEEEKQKRLEAQRKLEEAEKNELEGGGGGGDKKNAIGSFMKKVSHSVGDLFKPNQGQRVSSTFKLDDYILNSAQKEQDGGSNSASVRVKVGDTMRPFDEEEAERLRQAQTYSEYSQYIQRHNERIKAEQMESIKVRTKDFVKSLFVEEAKDLAFLLLQQFISDNRLDFQQDVAKQLLWRLQMNLIRYLCGVLADLLAYVFGRKVLPKMGEEENPMNWMLYQMID